MIRWFWEGKTQGMSFFHFKGSSNNHFHIFRGETLPRIFHPIPQWFSPQQRFSLLYYTIEHFLFKLKDAIAPLNDKISIRKSITAEHRIRLESLLSMFIIHIFVIPQVVIDVHRRAHYTHGVFRRFCTFRPIALISLFRLVGSAPEYVYAFSLPSCTRGDVMSSRTEPGSLYPRVPYVWARRSRRFKGISLILAWHASARVRERWSILVSIWRFVVNPNGPMLCSNIDIYVVGVYCI